MSFLTVVVVYPVLLGVLSVGAGLAVQSRAGVRLPAALIPAAGFSALIVLSQFVVLSAALAPLTPWALVVLALVGFALGGREMLARLRSSGRSAWLLPAAAVLAYVTVALPLIASGRLTFPGYLLDTTAGFHLAAGEYMLHHGAGLPAPYPAYGAMLNAYYGNGYPSGGPVLLAASGWLSGQDLLWLYFPFQVFVLAVSAPVLAFIGERAGLPRWAAAVAGWIAAVPALVAAYAMMGSIKELTALPALLLMGALIALVPSLAARKARGAVPFSVAAAAAIGAIGPAAVAWIGVLGLAVIARLVPLGSRLWSVRVRARSRISRSPGPLLVPPLAVVAIGVLVVVLAVPTLTRLGSSLNTAEAISGSNPGFANDPGNLLRPLRFVQAFGIWLGGSHRVDPQYLDQTYLLIGVAIVCLGLGGIWLVRRRSWSVLAWAVASAIVWFVLFKRGTEWTDAKVMMLSSPFVVLIALVGAFGEVRRHRLQGLVLAFVLGASVLASDALLYHSTNMAPAGRFSELISIGHRFAGQGPTLLPDFNEYTFYALRDLDIDSPGFAGDMRRPFLLFGGAPGYGHSYDIDDIEAPFVQQFKLVVMRRSPRWSRPPGDFRLVWEGAYYDVWRRGGPIPRLHVPASLNAAQPLGHLACTRLRSLANKARSFGAQLRYATRPPDGIAKLAIASHSADVVPGSDADGLAELSWGGPGRARMTVDVPRGGRYELWLGGYVDRALHVFVDGRLVGEPSHQSGGDGTMIDVGSIELSPGRHAVALVRGGGGLAPGNDSGTIIDGVYLQSQGAEQEAVTTIAPDAYRSLCGRLVDWVEVT